MKNPFLSSCCQEGIGDGVCVECGRCLQCDGTGEVSCYVDDGEGHIQRGVGTCKCDNPSHEPDDFSGAGDDEDR